MDIKNSLLFGRAQLNNRVLQVIKFRLRPGKIQSQLQNPRPI